MMRLTTTILVFILAVVAPSCASADPMQRPLSAEQLMNSWRVDYGTGQMIAPGGALLIPIQADHVALCYRRLVDAIGDDASFYLAAFGGPYMESRSGSIAEVHFFRSEYLFFINERSGRDFDEFLRLQPRYLCTQRGGTMTILIDSDSSLEPVD